MPRSSYWTNSDGLVVGFGPRTVENNSGAQPALGGLRQQVKIRVQANTIPDSDVSAQLLHGVTIPADSLIESAKLFVTTAFVGVNAVLDIGVYNASTGEAVDDDGIDAAIATATLADNAVIACDGDDLGVVCAVPTKIGLSYDTAAFTAGEAWLVVEYIPKG